MRWYIYGFRGLGYGYFWGIICLLYLDQLCLSFCLYSLFGYCEVGWVLQGLLYGLVMFIQILVEVYFVRFFIFSILFFLYLISFFQERFFYKLRVSSFRYMGSFYERVGFFEGRQGYLVGNGICFFCFYVRLQIRGFSFLVN